VFSLEFHPEKVLTMPSLNRKRKGTVIKIIAYTIEGEKENRDSHIKSKASTNNRIQGL